MSFQSNLVFRGSLVLIAALALTGCGPSRTPKSEVVRAFQADAEEVPLLVAAVAGSRANEWGDESAGGVAAFLAGCEETDDLGARHCQRLQEDSNIDTSPYYRDAARVVADADVWDSTPPDGIDTAHVLFYVGHATPKYLSTSSGTVPIRHLRIGDGSLRYLLACACQVLAHGPVSTTAIAGEVDFVTPNDFYRLAGNSSAFTTWQDAIASGLRMICGGSTLLCDSSKTIGESFWLHNRFNDVADSFLLAAAEGADRIPVCLSQGDGDPAASPLGRDRRFTAAAAGGAAGSYLHLLYPAWQDWQPDAPFDDLDERLNLAAANVTRLPLLVATRTDVSRLLDEALHPGAEPSAKLEDGSERIYTIDLETNMIFYETALPDVDSPIYGISVAGEERDGRVRTSRERTADVFERIGLRPPLSDAAVSGEIVLRAVIKLMYQTLSLVDLDREVYRRLKGTRYKYVRRRDIESHAPNLAFADFLGPADHVELADNAAPDRASVSLLWRDISPREPEMLFPIKGYDDAEAEAWRQLDRNRSEYMLRKWEWGYRADDPRCARALMPLVYRFYFQPRRAEDWQNGPARVLDISGFIGQEISTTPCGL